MGRDPGARGRAGARGLARPPRAARRPERIRAAVHPGTA
ncbi:prokaryotic cytochrome b561 domain protein, partial [Bordetella hinzii L60]